MAKLLLKTYNAKRKIQLATLPNPGGLDGGGRVDVALDLGHVHVRLVHSVRRDTVVILKDKSKKEK